MKIYIGSDHRGIDLRDEIYNYLLQQNLDIQLSTIKNNETDDYPDFAFDVANHVINSEDSLGIVICGNGIGISIAANKVKGIRCARVTEEEDAYKAKNHNGANMIAFGGIELEKAKKIVDTFINTPIASEERHLKRIQKISNYENESMK